MAWTGAADPVNHHARDNPFYYLKSKPLTLGPLTDAEKIALADSYAVDEANDFWPSGDSTNPEASDGGSADAEKSGSQTGFVDDCTDPVLLYHMMKPVSVTPSVDPASEIRPVLESVRTKQMVISADLRARYVAALRIYQEHWPESQILLDEWAKAKAEAMSKGDPFAGVAEQDAETPEAADEFGSLVHDFGAVHEGIRSDNDYTAETAVQEPAALQEGTRSENACEDWARAKRAAKHEAKHETKAQSPQVPGPLPAVPAMAIFKHPSTPKHRVRGKKKKARHGSKAGPGREKKASRHLGNQSCKNQ